MALKGQNKPKVGLKDGGRRHKLGREGGQNKPKVGLKAAMAKP